MIMPITKNIILPGSPVLVIVSAVIGAAVVFAVVGAAVVFAAVPVPAGVGVAADAQIPLVIVLESSVTSPFLASNCPWIVAPVWAAIDVNAKM